MRTKPASRLPDTPPHAEGAARPVRSSSASLAPARAVLPLHDVQRIIRECTRCERLRAYCERVAREKKPAHRADVYWGRPVHGFGDPRARVLVLGLAPAAHGANRTGRVFTGDGSGDFLMHAMHGAGFASIATSRRSVSSANPAPAVRSCGRDRRP